MPNATSTALNRRATVVALVAAWPLASAWAVQAQAQAAQASATAPQEVMQAVPAPALRGQGVLRFLGLKVYSARLWAAAAFEPERWDAFPLALELQYARALSGKAIASRSLEEMRRGGDITEADAQRWLAFMNEVFPDVNAGDRITGLWLAVKGQVSIHVNGVARGTLNDAAFGKRFFGIWLSPQTSQPSLRAALLGAPT